MENILIFILNPILIILFGYALFLGFKIIKELYGGKFTSVLPSLIGAISLLFLMQILEFIFLFTPLHDSITFLFSLQMLQLSAGILFIQSTYKFYQLGFATSGFFGDK